MAAEGRAMQTVYLERCAELHVRPSPEMATAFCADPAEVHTLDCGDMALGDNGVRAVLDAARRCPALRALHVHGNNLSAAGVSDVLRFAAAMPELVELDLRGGDCTVAGAELLALAREKGGKLVMRCDGTLLPVTYRRGLGCGVRPGRHRRSRSRAPPQQQGQQQQQYMAADEFTEAAAAPERGQLPQTRGHLLGFPGIAEEVKTDKLRQLMRAAARQHERERDALREQRNRLEQELASARGAQALLAARAEAGDERLRSVRDRLMADARREAARALAAETETMRVREEMCELRRRHERELAAERARLAQAALDRLRAAHASGTAALAAANARETVRTHYLRLAAYRIMRQQEDDRARRRAQERQRACDFLAGTTSSGLLRSHFKKLLGFWKLQRRRRHQGEVCELLCSATEHGLRQRCYRRLEQRGLRGLHRRRQQLRIERLRMNVARALALRWWLLWSRLLRVRWKERERQQLRQLELAAAHAAQDQLAAQHAADLAELEVGELEDRLEGALLLVDEVAGLLGAALGDWAAADGRLRWALAEAQQEAAQLRAEVERLEEEMEELRAQLAAALSQAPRPPAGEPPDKEEQEGRRKIEEQEEKGRLFLKRLLSRIEKPFGKTGSIGFAVETDTQAQREPSALLQPQSSKSPKAASPRRSRQLSVLPSPDKAGRKAPGLQIYVEPPEGSDSPRQLSDIGRVDISEDQSQVSEQFSSPRPPSRPASPRSRKSPGRARGVVIKRVVGGGAAEAAGLLAGDKVIAVRNPRMHADINSQADLLDQVGPLGHVFEGVNVTLTVLRKGSSGAEQAMDVTFQMGPINPAVKESRCRHLERTFRPVFGPAFDPVAAYDLEHDPDRCRETLKQVFDECDDDGSGSLELTEIRNVVSRVAKRLGVPEPPQQQVSLAMKEADIDGSGDLEFEEFFYYLRDLFMDVIYGRVPASS
eukprot:TRINITY_DN17969_c0_g1_i1.p1 TRINITY_DN17969_c0_g1~~TRINITY_DN17969_c0_g1_i1.p1  ORF type:complete len:1029 (+),score=352.05 TRINITY_DN17969_c0_g1_i1:262-3087(+)